jgi:hypothetical protein
MKSESEQAGQAGRCVYEKKRRALALVALQIHSQPEFTRQQNLKCKQVTAQEFQTAAIGSKEKQASARFTRESTLEKNT